MIFLFPPGVQCAVTHNSMSKIVLKVLLKSISVKRYRHDLWQTKSTTKILGPGQTITQKTLIRAQREELGCALSH